MGPERRLWHRLGPQCQHRHLNHILALLQHLQLRILWGWHVPVVSVWDPHTQHPIPMPYLHLHLHPSHGHNPTLVLHWDPNCCTGGATGSGYGWGTHTPSQEGQAKGTEPQVCYLLLGSTGGLQVTQQHLPPLPQRRLQLLEAAPDFRLSLSPPLPQLPADLGHQPHSCRQLWEPGETWGPPEPPNPHQPHLNPEAPHSTLIQLWYPAEGGYEDSLNSQTPQ